MALELVDGPRVVAEVDGEVITSNTGVLRLGAADRAIELIERFAECCTDTRGKHRRVDALRTRAGQRVHAIAPGHGDLVDQGRLRHGPTLGGGTQRLEALHGRCAPLISNSTTIGWSTT